MSLSVVSERNSRQWRRKPLRCFIAFSKDFHSGPAAPNIQMGSIKYKYNAMQLNLNYKQAVQYGTWIQIEHGNTQQDKDNGPLESLLYVQKMTATTFICLQIYLFVISNVKFRKYVNKRWPLVLIYRKLMIRVAVLFKSAPCHQKSDSNIVMQC